jgi:hypothetical protein
LAYLKLRNSSAPLFSGCWQGDMTKLRSIVENLLE